ncbi:peptidyl-prolyl cis-trans isomerase FKBP17-1, chloroplastic isoform X2 [Juglans microcarpa x Juglans regia]|uniref:peptidyl-prolyl cis-trans isomerase FKBP17-1, chloroplastic isoform X2 n=1 Tax=Juglans microcarpa x Juglans regia TaxID=2249226 RepID=UPI001B7DDC2A|nr:peptidyl-prolyl cis-trans isomerase FKBP17-1, chloroplastic isoform X2 [Juglans microcarpa x Juglans regia]
MTVIQCSAAVQSPPLPHHPKSPSNAVSATTLVSSSSFSSSPTTSRRAALSLSLFSTAFPTLVFSSSASSSKSAVSEFSELPNSGGVKVLDLRFGSGDVPLDGDQVAVHYYGRLAAKQGWRFDSTYDHKDENGEPIPFVFFLGSGKVISGIEAAVRSMKVGGIRRVVIPPSQGYQSTSQEPIPPNYFDRQRLFTTIFNPTRLANGEGSTLGTLIFDIELVNLRHQ